jgi:hypothetical protein
MAIRPQPHPERSCVSCKQAVVEVIPLIDVVSLRLQPRDEPMKSVVPSISVGILELSKFLTVE